MGEISDEGWFVDPFGRHEARWLSDGRPTQLVRDGGVESNDEPPETQIVGPAVRVPLARPVVAELLRSTPAPSRSFLTTGPGLDFHVDLMIGIHEKHHVTYDWGQFWGTTTILVDGGEVLRKRVGLLSFRLRWRHEILVGNTERHRFAVEHTAPWFWGGLRVHTFHFFVDDQLVYSY